MIGREVSRLGLLDLAGGRCSFDRKTFVAALRSWLGCRLRLDTFEFGRHVLELSQISEYVFDILVCLRLDGPCVDLEIRLHLNLYNALY